LLLAACCLLLAACCLLLAACCLLLAACCLLLAACCLLLAALSPVQPVELRARSLVVHFWLDTDADSLVQHDCPSELHFAHADHLA